MPHFFDDSVNPYAISVLERLPARLLMEGKACAREMAERGSGYGAIERKLRCRGIGVRAAQELAFTALWNRSLRTRIFGGLRMMAGVSVLLAAWLLSRFVLPRFSIALAMFGMFLLMTGCAGLFHSMRCRRYDPEMSF